MSDYRAWMWDAAERSFVLPPHLQLLPDELAEATALLESDVDDWGDA